LSHPVVSVCLPVFNGEKYLPSAIESVLSQTLANFELIVVDDCSTDRSLEIISKYAAGDKRIKLHRNESNLGIFYNYNKCMELGKGRYIKPFAQDDLFYESLLERMVNELEHHPAISLVTCTREYVDEGGAVLSVERHFAHDREMDGKKAAFEMLSTISNFIGEPCAVMFRRKQMGPGFMPTLPQLGDIEYWVRLLQSGNVFFIADALCKFRVHSGNQTKKNIANLDYLADLIAIRELYHKFLAQGGLSREAFSASILQKSIDVTNYAASIGISYSQRAAAGRPKELGMLLVEVLNRLAKVEPECASLRAQVVALEEEKSNLAHQLNDILSSPSWKVTAGLRGFRKLTSSLLDNH
jgi:glycosyltransferase involved in cell wall biosynthesis